MRIAVYSDVHLEFGKFRLTPPECDVVILSGDIGVGNMAFPWIEKTFPDTPVVYVAGNHEHYGRVLSDQYALMAHKAKEFPNVSFLQNSSVIIGDVRFIGATLWTDFNLYGNQPVSMMAAQQKMNDYRKVSKADRVPFSAQDSCVEHMFSFQYIRDALERPFNGKTVVVTHHGPSEMSVPKKWGGDSLNPAYASRLENLMLDHAPVLWTHGHIHSNSDYEIGSTRVVCNPRGYVGHELNKDFNPQLVIEI
jgi:Icc-related predicted phosphoesterase